ncbi:MAG: LysR family transcriptional regulator [Lachnospiraceae bacterium]|nr:LysR family transcriptional regulator [Lachnospiraceae bacterium]
MDTQNLRTFLTLATEKNFTRTAAQLYVAQSTVTNRIAQLELETGKQLIRRGKKSLSLTEEGLLFLNYAKRIVELEDMALKEIHSSEQSKTALRIGTTNTFYECYLYPHMQNFLPEHPQIAPSVTIGHSLNLLQMLQDGLLDLTFTYTPLQRPEFSCALYKTDALVLVTRPDKNAYPEGIRKKDLGRLYYLFCNFALQDVGLFIKELFPPLYQFPFEIDNSTKVVDYLLDGIGASFLPEGLVRSYLESGRLTSIPLLDFEAPKINSYVSCRPGSPTVDLYLGSL